ncbi:MAG: universal stress protein [Proteobacteria bacterium]|nr:universal stress protein [Pseudomonadota bacterium]
MKMLCATDLWAKSDAALERAGILADRLDADLLLLHIVSTDSSDVTLEERLQRALTQITARARPPLWKAQCAPRLGVLPGNPARLILESIEESKARLLILGPHRRRPLRDLVEGTVVERALESRKCPVLVVRDTPRGPYKRVLLALDSTPASASAVSAAATLVLMPNTAAQVVHVFEPPYAGIPQENVRNLERDAVRTVRGILERERAYFSSFAIEVDHGEPASAILRSVEQYQPDLLVMGTRGMSRLRRTLSVSVANRVLSEVERDVLIVPEGSFVGPIQDRWSYVGQAGEARGPATPRPAA